MPYGEQDDGDLMIGSLDLIAKQHTTPILGTGSEQLSGTGAVTQKEAKVDGEHNTFDLVIMNPPFTRPTNHEATDVRVPSFAGFRTESNAGKNV